MLIRNLNDTPPYANPLAVLCVHEEEKENNMATRHRSSGRRSSRSHRSTSRSRSRGRKYGRKAQGEVRTEMHHMRSGKHPVKNRKQGAPQRRKGSIPVQAIEITVGGNVVFGRKLDASTAGLAALEGVLLFDFRVRQAHLRFNSLRLRQQCVCRTSAFLAVLEADEAFPRQSPSGLQHSVGGGPQI